VKNHIDLVEVSNKVLDILKEFGLNPAAFGVSIVLEKDEFERLAENHPDHREPRMIIKTNTESNGLQWAVQILQRMVIDNSPDD
jgi:hypothetical protein